jgi:hypothetical protein
VALLDVFIIILYAPSGAEKRLARETFFNQEVTYLFPTSTTHLVMAGDFNCVTSPTYCTGKPTKSRALKFLLAGKGLVDIWDTLLARPMYTHFTSGVATRIDRIYITDALLARKQGTEIIPAAFIVHLAFMFRMTLATSVTIPRTFLWRMNIPLLRDRSFNTHLRVHRAVWRRAAHFKTKLQWWDQYAKSRIRQVFQREGTARQRERSDQEELYYDMMYQALRCPLPTTPA